MDAKPFHIIDGICQGVHLHLAGIARTRIHFADGERAPERVGIFDCLRIDWSLGGFSFWMLPCDHACRETFLQVNTPSYLRQNQKKPVLF